MKKAIQNLISEAEQTGDLTRASGLTLALSLTVREIEVKMEEADVLGDLDLWWALNDVLRFKLEETH